EGADQGQEHGEDDHLTALGPPGWWQEGTRRRRRWPGLFGHVSPHFLVCRREAFHSVPSRAHTSIPCPPRVLASPDGAWATCPLPPPPLKTPSSRPCPLCRTRRSTGRSPS